MIQYLIFIMKGLMADFLSNIVGSMVLFLFYIFVWWIMPIKIKSIIVTAIIIFLIFYLARASLLSTLLNVIAMIISIYIPKKSIIK